MLLIAPTGTDLEGFAPNLSGQMTKLVSLRDVTRLEEVETYAVWQGRRVEVVELDGGQAWIQQWQWPVPGHPAAYAIENGLWGAKVPVEELTEVVETVTEVPFVL